MRARRPLLAITGALLALTLTWNAARAPAEVTILPPRADTHTPLPSATASRTVIAPTRSQTRSSSLLSATPLPLPSATSTLTPTPVSDWAWHDAGLVIAPILLYHHIAEPDEPSRYTVAPNAFRRQVERLKAWGYKPVSLAHLAEVIANGGVLPERPVVLTFDDGYDDVFENALPVMQEAGFPGVVYVIAGVVDEPQYLSQEQLLGLVEAGWEIGSHGDTHNNLRLVGKSLDAEVSGSRAALEELLSVAVQTFSFPYGLTSSAVTKLVKESGYTSAVGLGGFSRHSPKTLFYLSRIEIPGGISLKEFSALLPWGDTSQPSPTPTEAGKE